MHKWVFYSALFVGLASPAFPQGVQVSPQNRTIEVFVTESVQVEPDIANVTLGCIAYGQTHDQAYQANLQLADKIIKSLNDAGVPKTQITSDSVELSETNPGDVSDQPAGVRRLRQFKALQSWRIHVPAANAQKIIDVAVQAGANGIEDVTWDVANTEVLESRARGAAFEKARATAADLAKASGGKVGNLLYASNSINTVMGLSALVPVQTASAEVQVRSGNGFNNPSFSLQLFPQKVERQAAVRAIFALE